MNLIEDDRASARAREAMSKDRTPSVLAYILTGGLFLFIVLLPVKDIPPGSARVVNLTLGSIGTAWVRIISYCFGSSSGSKSKECCLTARQRRKVRNEPRRDGPGGPTLSHVRGCA